MRFITISCGAESGQAAGTVPVSQSVARAVTEHGLASRGRAQVAELVLRHLSVLMAGQWHACRCGAARGHRDSAAYG